MSSSISCTGLAAWTVASVLLQILGISLFVFGFFPVKPALPGVSGIESYREPCCNDTGSSEGRDLPPDQLESLYKEMSNISHKYDRLVMMVIDGLPAEFVLGRENMPPPEELMDAMPYTQYLISNGNAIGYHAKAAPPTVTMPRLKAIVSGAIGSFLDVAFNFNTNAFLDDNLLEQFYHIGWKMVMHGDETWIKLFPDFFERKDGVGSFFVKDTVEVDYNVSRHLESELAANDWNVLIFHYLGLDHVGHIGGRRSVLMVPKLKEMDEVIERIYTSILHEKKYGKRTLLLVISDHGMTDGGNHGGSSYEETDSLALFIDPQRQIPNYEPVSCGPTFQVDIAPTLALLFGVPIPKNSVGVVLMQMLNFLTDEERLRAMELNSWQLLRLLRAQLPGLICGNTPSSHFEDKISGMDKPAGNILETLDSLYLKALESHASWKKINYSSSSANITSYYINTVDAYRNFLGTASAWLMNRATDKPPSMLAAGVTMITMSSCALFKIFFCLLREIIIIQRKDRASVTDHYSHLNLDESFIIFALLLHVISLGSSSLVEEEQYIWHFLASTLYMVFLFMKIQAILLGLPPTRHDVKDDMGKKPNNFFNCSLLLKEHSDYFQICFLLIVLSCGRVLRGWHQGGINWTYLPDVSKWLERSGTFTIEFFQIVSLFLVMIFGSFTIYFLKSMKYYVKIVLMGHFISGMLILLDMMKHHGFTIATLNYDGNLIPQILYAVLVATVVTVFVSPWLLKIHLEPYFGTSGPSSRSSMNLQIEDACLLGIRDCIHLIGGTLTASWCFLQLLLQHPLDAIPIVLLLLQILASIFYFKNDTESRQRQWVEVVAMYFLGMAGHFSIGNTNSIATIDVAGAFTGLSSHSTMLAGILMFIITYASPLLFSLGIIMCLPVENLKFSKDLHSSELSHGLKITIGFPCLVPLVLNSATLTVFTVVLLLMRNHLFVWSVFSPKYLYVCTASMSVYLGVTIIATFGTYVCSVLFYRMTKRYSSAGVS